MALPKRPRVAGLPKADPWKPPDWEPEDGHALQDVAYGRASEDQQRRAFKFIVESICGTYDLSYRSANPHDTSFAEGKRFVGLQLVKFAKLNLAAVRGKETEQGTAPKEQPT